MSASQLITLIVVVVYAVVMIAIGIITSRKTKNVNDFVFGGNKIGPWMTAFAFGTAYFSAAGATAFRPHGSASAMRSSARRSHGPCSASAPAS